MKKFRNILVKMSLLLLAIIVNISCNDYFETVPEDEILSIDKVLETRDGALEYLSTVYTFIPDGFKQRYPDGPLGYTNGTPMLWVSGSDESEIVWSFVASHSFNNGTLSPSSDVVSEYWTKYYKGIRVATEFIENLEICKALISDDYAQWTAEAKALRAIYYYYLLKIYGPVPIVDGLISENSSLDELSIPRNSITEVGEYIISELESAQNSGLISNIKVSDDVASKYKGLGHIDQAIAQAFIVQTQMLLASDLYNGSNEYFAQLANADGKLLFPTYDDAGKVALWAKAAASAKQFIDTYVGYGYELCRLTTEVEGVEIHDPYMSYREAVRGATSELTDVSKGSSAEMIFFNEKVAASDLQYERTPKHIGGIDGVRASSGMSASQEVVDAYFMANGIAPILGYSDEGLTPIINEASGYKEDAITTEPYVCPITGRELAPAGIWNAWYGREPRFYADITFDGQLWLHDNIITSFQYDGNSGRGQGSSNDYSPTGYQVRKSAPTAEWGNNDRICILMRLPQIYLDYAEALNESDPSNTDIAKYVNIIRERAGIPQYGVDGFPMPDDMRQAIRDERRIELSFEGERYFDVRRWCIAEQTEDKNLHGMDILQNAPEFYTRVVADSRQFDKKNYFFPIPQGDILINKNLVQNPGW